jgi:AbrB family looped-hinge helix DNA binding protein
MRLTGKSQVTVPKRVRDALGLGPGSEVDFKINDKQEVQLIKLDSDRPGETRGERVVRLLQEAGRRYKRSGLTTDEIMEMTRGPFDDIDSR